MPQQLVISDYQTIQLIDRLVQVAGFRTKTDAVNAAARAMLLGRGIDADREAAPKNLAEAALVAKLDEELRAVTRAYVSLREEKTGAKSGSRMYQMLTRRGAVETVKRVVAEPTEGLDFLAEHERLDLAFETIALKHEYRPLFEDSTLRQANENLDKAKTRRSR